MSLFQRSFVPFPVEEGDKFIREDALVLTARVEETTSGRNLILESDDGYVVRVGAFKHVFESLGLKRL